MVEINIIGEKQPIISNFVETSPFYVYRTFILEGFQIDDFRSSSDWLAC